MKRGDLPEELRRREDRLAAIRAAKARLEAEQRAADDARGRKPSQTRNPRGGRPYKREYGEPDESAQSNFTDPESRIMKTSSEGFQQCCNAQMAVEGENHLVVGADVTDNASDQGRLIPMLDAVEETCGETPEQVPADASCCNEPDLQVPEDRDIDGYAVLDREGKTVTVANPDRPGRGLELTGRRLGRPPQAHQPDHLPPELRQIPQPLLHHCGRIPGQGPLAQARQGTRRDLHRREQDLPEPDPAPGGGHREPQSKRNAPDDSPGCPGVVEVADRVLGTTGAVESTGCAPPSMQRPIRWIASRTGKAQTDSPTARPIADDFEGYRSNKPGVPITGSSRKAPSQMWS